MSTRLEPWDELSEKSLRKVDILTQAAFEATNTKEVNLATDTMKVPGQNFACVSFVSPSSNQKNQNLGMKIRGVFDTRDDATEYIKRLIRIDPMFDIYICDMYNWCLVPPDPEMVGDQNYQDETLHGIISEYRKNQIYAKEHFEERKREMIEQAADERKKAALQRLEEESQAELEASQESIDNNECHIKAVNQEERFTDVSEIYNDASEQSSFEQSSFTKTNEFVTASELMESMRNGCKIEES